MIRLTDHSYRTVSPETGRAMFLMQIGQLRGTPKQEAYVKRIERIYLNWENAPPEYRRQYPRDGREVKQGELWWTQR